MNNAGYYPVLAIFSQRNSPASEPGQRIFSVSPGTAGNRLDRWLSECLPSVSRARIQAVIAPLACCSMVPRRRPHRSCALMMRLCGANRRSSHANRRVLAVLNKLVGVVAHPDHFGSLSGLGKR
jgi:hypothetical protein